jgi:hypothetical protein
MMKLCILIAVGCLTSVEVAQGATYYVSKAGSDNSSCAQAQSVSSSKRSLASGSACLSAGDTLVVRAGTYAEALKDAVRSGTSWSSKVRIAAYPGETVWLRPTGDYVVFFSGEQRYIELDGINIDGTNAVSGTVVLGDSSNHIRLQNAEIIGSPTSGWCAAICGGHYSELLNLTIHGGGPTQDNCGGAQCNSYGIYTGGDNNLIDGCEIYDPGGTGIQIYHGSGQGAAANNIIRNTRIHDITRSGEPRMWGIIIGNGSGNQIYNNIIYNGLGNADGNNAGIYVYGASGTSIYNNTVYNIRAQGIFISGQASGTQVKNNVAYQSTGGNYNNGGSGTIASNNLFDSDPLFENSGSGDFRLQSGSPARDQGTTLASVTKDFQGVLRPQGGDYDIGAYEYQPVQSPLPRTPAAPTGLFIVTN